MQNDIRKILISKEAIANKVEELGKTITAEYEGLNPLIVCILKGAVVFFADLIRNISLPIEIDFLAVSSYGASTLTSGAVRVLKDLDKSIENRHILLIEDIVDTGLTLDYIKNMLVSRRALSVKTCVLLDKPSHRKVELKPEYCGFTVENYFLVGYGLDYNERYRNLQDICILKPEIYD
ncbi:MAG: hypoxanthine phosphoribosyltransferase [Firmicutes bacterium]|nr:hypoxanthine phosphoribosyltransferase [Bacillota bacterium]